MKRKISNFKEDSLKIFLFCVVFCFLAGPLQAQSKKTFTSNGSWTVPAGVTSVKIEAIGGGGAGGYVHGSGVQFQCSGGGGGAAYARVNSLPVAEGDVLTIVIGNGGQALATEGNQVHGGATTVSKGGSVVVKAAGGKTVLGTNTTSGAAGGSLSDCIGDVRFSGGNGGDGLHNGSNAKNDKPGGGGGAAGSGGNGNHGTQMTGGAAKAEYGGQGANAIAQGWDNPLNSTGVGEGNSGRNYGGGGSGSKCTGIGGEYGGSGAAGIVVITFEVSVICDATPGAIAAAEWTCSAGDTSLNISSTVDATSTVPGTYSWERSTDNGSSWSVIADMNANSYTVVRASGMYRRGYTVEGCATVYSNLTANLEKPSTVDPGMISYAGSTSNMNQHVCKGSSQNFALTANTTYSNIVWRVSKDGSNWNNDLGTGSSISYAFGDTTAYIRYFILVSSSCEVPSNNMFVVNAHNKPVVNAITVPTNLCPNQTEYTVSADITSDAPIASYDWIGATGTSDVAIVSQVGTNDNNHTYNVALQVTDAIGCASTFVNNSFTVTEATAPVFDPIVIPAVSNAICTEYHMPDSLTIQAALQNAFTNNNCSSASDFILVDLADMTVYDFGEDITSTKPTAVTGHYKHDREYFTGTEEFTFTLTYPVVSEITFTPAPNTVVCSGETTTLTVEANNNPVSYAWSAGTSTTNVLETPAVDNHTSSVISTAYTVTVTNDQGCQSTKSITVYTAPSAAIGDASLITKCTPAATVTYDPASITTNEIPTGTSGAYTFDTKYTWTISSNSGVTGAQANTTPAATFTTAGTLENTTLASQTVVYEVTPTTVTTESGSEYNTCDGESFDVSIMVKPSITNDADFYFDDADFICTLYYGVCDTLLYIPTPDFSTNITEYDGLLVLSNNVSTENHGTFFGRIPVGEHSIVWKVTDPCGNYLTFTKKYIVRYPNCGEADPNYTEPFRATDADGISYKTVRIGCECWTQSNLRSETYQQDGSAIAIAKVYVSDEYPNETENLENFGRLYSWYSAMKVAENDDEAVPATTSCVTGPYVQGVCPDGWAIPTADIFNSMKSIAGSMDNVKTADASKWLPDHAGVAPGVGFEAFGAGIFDYAIDRYCNLLGQTDYWTSSVGTTIQKGICSEITHSCPELITKDYMKGMGFSIRCVKRQE